MAEEKAALRIAVLIKQVIDSAAITIDGAAATVTIGPERALNTYDAYGLATALELKEHHGGSVTAIAAGNADVQEVLLRAMAIGADEGLLVKTDGPVQIETLNLARMLAEVLANGAYDLVIAGQSSEDYESGQTGPQVAEVLGLPHVSLVTEVALDGRELQVHRDAEGTKEVLAVDLPAMLIVLTGRNGEQRYPTLRGMMSARKRGVTIVEAAGLSNSARLRWSAPQVVQRESHGIIVSDTPAAESASQLIAWMKEKRLI